MLTDQTIFEKHQNGNQNSSTPPAQNGINNSYSIIDTFLGTEVLVQAEGAIGVFIDQFKEEAKEHYEDYTNYKEMMEKLGEEKENEDDPDAPSKEPQRELNVEQPEMNKVAETYFEASLEELESHISGIKETIDAKNKALVLLGNNR